MDVKVLGAASEVGRSGFLVNCNGTKLLLDYGVMFGRRGTPPVYPLHVKPKDLDAIIITLLKQNNMMKNAKEIGFKQKEGAFITLIFSLRLFDQK